MKTDTEKTELGSITLEGNKYPHDVLIGLDGQVQKRKKKLSKEVYGTSHVLSLAEAQFIYEQDSEGLIFGTGQYDTAGLSDEAAELFKVKSIKVKLLTTPNAIAVWNEAKGATEGLLHVTC